MTDKAPSGHERWTAISNKPQEGVSYYTPAQSPPAGTAINPQSDGKEIPLLFQPLKIRGLTMQNRIMLSPLCQYSAIDGHPTDWHLTHLGGIIQRGVGLTMVEATAVQAIGRISPQDAGLYKDSHIAPFKRITEYAHSQNQKIGVQIGHAGRKASTVAPWLGRSDVASKEADGWPDEVVGPSAIAWDTASPTPKELTLEDIEQLKKDWVAAVKRAITAGFDFVEIHSAHGYLLHNFLSPHSNHRTDKYGGSFENRIRLILEITELTRANIPADMPLFLRLSATDWLEHLPQEPQWTQAESVKLSLALAATGHIDLIDVSSAGNSPQQKITTGPGYQVHFAAEIRKALHDAGYDKVIIGSVGSITEGPQAAGYLAEGKADVAIVGRQLLKDPYTVWTWAEQLGVEVQLANQHRWAFPHAGKHKTNKL